MNPLSSVFSFCNKALITLKNTCTGHAENTTNNGPSQAKKVISLSDKFKYCHDDSITLKNAYEMPDGGLIANIQIGGSNHGNWYYKPTNSDVFFQINVGMQGMHEDNVGHKCLFSEDQVGARGTLITGAEDYDSRLINSDGTQHKLTKLSKKEMAALQQDFVDGTLRANTIKETRPEHVLKIDDEQTLLIARITDNSEQTHRMFLFNSGEEGISKKEISRYWIRTRSRDLVEINTEMGEIEIRKENFLATETATLNGKDINVEHETTDQLFNKLIENEMLPPPQITIFPGMKKDTMDSDLANRLERILITGQP